MSSIIKAIEESKAQTSFPDKKQAQAKFVAKPTKFSKKIDKVSRVAASGFLKGLTGKRTFDKKIKRSSKIQDPINLIGNAAESAGFALGAAGAIRGMNLGVKGFNALSKAMKFRRLDKAAADPKVTLKQMQQMIAKPHLRIKAPPQEMQRQLATFGRGAATDEDFIKSTDEETAINMLKFILLGNVLPKGRRKRRR